MAEFIFSIARDAFALIGLAYVLMVAGLVVLEVLGSSRDQPSAGHSAPLSDGKGAA